MDTFGPLGSSARQRGFTLVELITVMVIIGIIGAVGAQRYFNRTSFDGDSYTQQVRALLRYGQKVAVAQNRSVFVRLDFNSVALCFNFQADAGCAAANRVLAASGSNSGSASTMANCAASPTWACEGRPSSLNYSSTPATAYFYFDALGRPYAAADADGVLASTFVTLVLVVSGDGISRPVIVEAESGYVH